ncbi:MAG: hypothetical protein JO093_19820 [Acidobacteria bacterium]|nr:hypothetical protein [Acidobacteriota bacterium]MBV9187873.1 hypothetical protein [Acidobacteriota bacterium]
MRKPVTEPVVREFMRAIAAEAREPGRIYLAGGASVVLKHWRRSTVDIDITIIPENDRILRAIPDLKERLHVNVELSSPTHFVPPLPGWEDRCPFITREGAIDFHHFDFYTQALSKIERAHRKDLLDVDSMIRNGFVDPRRLLALFEEVSGQLYRYPVLNPPTLRAAVERLASAALQ